MRYLERLNTWFNQRLAWVAGGTLVAMMLLSVVNMFLRALGHPFGGTAEVVGWLAAITAAFALGYTQLYRGHVAIDLVVNRFSRRGQGVTDAIMLFSSAILFALAAWRTAVYAGRLWQLGSLSETIQIAFFPFTYAVALGFASLSLALLVDGLKSLKGAIKK